MVLKDILVPVGFNLNIILQWLQITKHLRCGFFSRVSEVWW